MIKEFDVHPDFEIMNALSSYDRNSDDVKDLFRLDKPFKNGEYKYHLAVLTNSEGSNYMKLFLRPSDHSDKHEQAWQIVDYGYRELAFEPDANLLRTGGITITDDNITEIYGEEVYKHADQVLEAFLKTHAEGREVRVRIDPYV